MRTAKLLILAPSLRDTSPGSRFRIEQWMPYLEDAGVSCTYASFEDAELHELIYARGRYVAKAKAVLRACGRRLALLDSLSEFDTVFIYEEAARIGPALLERIVRWLGLPVIYDFCDPIYLPYRSPTNHHFARFKCFGKTASICRLADHVLVGNEYLADYARRYNPRVSVVPITIDTRAYAVKPPIPAKEPSVPVVGWSGSHSTVPHLRGIDDVLRSLARLRRFRLEVIGAPRYELDGVEVRATPWSSTSEVADLHRFDIGIMPLPADRWTMLRSHLKIRQYMGVGLPVVASPVGVNNDLIRDSVNGFLATSREGWLDRLVRLIDDRDLRLRLGREARTTIETSFSAEYWARRVLEILDGVMRRRHRGAPEGSPAHEDCA